MRKKDSLAQMVNGDSFFLEIIELYYNLMYINHWMNEFKSLNKGIKEWLGPINNDVRNFQKEYTI